MPPKASSWCGTAGPYRRRHRLARAPGAADLLAVLVAEPSIIEAAAGIHGAVFALTGETPRRLQDHE
jgi:hypothetical protein